MRWTITNRKQEEWEGKKGGGEKWTVRLTCLLNEEKLSEPRKNIKFECVKSIGLQGCS